MRPLLDLILPVHCVGCGCPGAVVCAACEQALAAPPLVRWPTPAPPGLPPPVAVATYDGVVRSILLAYKEDGVWGLRDPLATALAASIAGASGMAAAQNGGSARLVVVPVPSTAAARRRRGSDVVAELAIAAATVLRSGGREVQVVRALRHGRRTRDSAGLSAELRAANLSGALTLRRGAAAVLAHPGVGAVLLADDLVTTGATLTEAARALGAVGVEVAAAATVAATVRHAGMARLGLPKRGY
jgi:predicted amidophosphoribosyltransferase